MVKENVGSFVAAVVASRAADFEYTVTVETSDDTAVGKQGRIAFSVELFRYTKLLPIITYVNTIFALKSSFYFSSLKKYLLNHILILRIFLPLIFAIGPYILSHPTGSYAIYHLPHKGCVHRMHSPRQCFLS